LDGKEKETKSDLARKCLGHKYSFTMITVRAQEDLGIHEELKTSGINKEKCYREIEATAISVEASMLCLDGTTIKRE
jgi:hypothetical protein